jgi:glycosyltransferase involved in cell wall biosynthesis
VFWSPDGLCSLLTSVPQIITIHDINFEHYPKDVPWIARLYFQFFFPKFARKAKHILTVSNYSKEDISKTYSISEQKISVVYNAPNSRYNQITEGEKLAIKKIFSADCNYFLFVGSIHPRKNIQRLIEGFALSKKDLGDFKLVIVGGVMWKDKFLAIPKEIEKDVIFLGHLSLENLTKVTSSAFALTYVPYFEGFGIPLVEAMKCGVPILAAEATCLPEVAGDAAIYCDAFDINSISKGMIELFENKNLREELSQKGLKRSQKFSWNQSAEQVWTCLEEILT